MISEQNPKTRPVGRVTYSEAMRSWFAGDFDGCLALCDRVRPNDVDMVSQLALLRARALLRLGRPDEAIQVVRNVFVAHDTLDASLTAQMLLGAAHVRRGDHRRGLFLLEAARAASAQAHPTIRSEIALDIALAHYALRDLDGVARALDEVAPTADIVHARALQTRGWLAVARGDYVGATDAFRAALLRLDGCRQTDRLLEAHTVQALAILAAERLDHAAWLFVEQRARRLDWTASGLAAPYYGIAISASMVEEVHGRIDEALRWAGEAEEVARNEGARLFATCRRATVLRTAGEAYGHRDLVARVRRAVQTLDLAAFDGDERGLAIALAIEVAASGDVLGGRALLKRYDDLPPPSPLLSLTGDRRPVGFRAFADAVVADAAGDVAQAHQCYREAFQIFHGIGYARRALLAALRLGELTGQTYLLEYVDRTLRRLADRSPLRARARLHHALPD